MQIEQIDKSNFPQVSKIYEEGIATEVATFETASPDWETWNKNHLVFGRIAMANHDKILGWAALSPVSSRCVYGGVSEVSIYVASDSRGLGIGKTLLTELISLSEQNNIWTLQSGIFPENKSSLALHASCGFRTIGYKERIGQLHGKWHDNVLLERRSKIVGI